MDLRVLQYYLTVAREENITRAAQLLHITQPTLSRQLRQLEEELGVKLFQRSKHSIYLTAEGLLFRRRAQEIVALAEKAKGELLPGEEDISGEILIGCGELRSSQYMADLLAAFQGQYPRVQFRIYSGNSDNIKERMEQGSLDLGLLLEPVDVSKYSFIRMPVKERWGAFVRADSPLAPLETLSPQDMAGQRLIYSDREAVRREVLNWLGPYAEQTEWAAGGNLAYNMTALVRSGMGVFITLDLACHYDGLKFIPLSPGLELSSVLAWKEHQVYSDAMGAFVQLAKKYKNSISYDEN